jgi:hypothetical protein
MKQSILVEVLRAADNIRGENQSYSAIGQALDVYFILEPHPSHASSASSRSGLPAYRMAQGGISNVRSLLIGAQSLDKGFHQHCGLITSLIPADTILPKRPPSPTFCYALTRPSKPVRV